MLPRFLAFLFILAAIRMVHAQEVVRLTVYFDSDRHDLSPEAIDLLDSAVNAIGVDRILQASVSGHADTTANKTYNKRLAERRGRSVRDVLVEDGVPTRKVRTSAFGDDVPAATNATPGGRAHNRRALVRFTVLPLPVEEVVSQRRPTPECPGGDTLVRMPQGVIVKLPRCDASSFFRCVDLVPAISPEDMVLNGLYTRTDAGGSLSTGGMFRMTSKGGDCGPDWCSSNGIEIRVPIDPCNVPRQRGSAGLWVQDKDGRWQRSTSARDRVRIRTIRDTAYAVFRIDCTGKWKNCDWPVSAKRVRIKASGGAMFASGALVTECRRSVSQGKRTRRGKLKFLVPCAQEYTLHATLAHPAMPDTTISVPLSQLHYGTSLFGGRCRKNGILGRPLLGIIPRKLRPLYPRYQLPAIEPSGPTPVALE